MTKMSIENCASAFSVHLKYWLENGNYDYDFNKYDRKNENDVVNVYLKKIKNEIDALNSCGIDEGYIINILKRHFTRKLNEEIEKFMEHKNKNDNPHKIEKYEFKILFNAKITKEKIIANLKKDKLGNTIIGTNVEFGKYLPIKLDSVVEDIKNDIKENNDVSDEKIFNLIICLIDINDYYNLSYPYKEKINEILPIPETKFFGLMTTRKSINKESLTEYANQKNYQKYLPLIFNEEPKPAADGRRKSKRRSSRRKSKRRSKKSKKRY
jgi:hypothetical protein